VISQIDNPMSDVFFQLHNLQNQVGQLQNHIMGLRFGRIADRMENERLKEELKEQKQMICLLSLQKAFQEGRLKPGLNIEQKPKRPLINNKEALTAKYTEMYLDLPWTERLDVTNAALFMNETELPTNDDEGLADNDFKREMLFYRQTQASVLEAIPRLKAARMATKRPDDYYAQIAKSDEHMKKIREYLVNRESDIENREKLRKLREQRLYGKKVQQEVLLKRQEEKSKLLKTMKKVRKGRQGGMQELEENLGDRKKNFDKSNGHDYQRNQKKMP
jgi:rRNA-processing protein EBP2